MHIYWYAYLCTSIADSRASNDGSGWFRMLSSSTASMAALMASRNCVSHTSSWRSSDDISHMFFSSSNVSIAVLVASSSCVLHMSSCSIVDSVLKNTGERGPLYTHWLTSYETYGFFGSLFLVTYVIHAAIFRLDYELSSITTWDLRQL